VMGGRLEGEQGVKRARTLKTQRAEGWIPRVQRTLLAGDRCREQNPRRGSSFLDGTSGGSRDVPEEERKSVSGWPRDRTGTEAR
jgi:hypothetical protein